LIKQGFLSTITKSQASVLPTRDINDDEVLYPQQGGELN